MTEIDRYRAGRANRAGLFVRGVAIGLAAVLFWSSIEHLKNPFAFLTSVLKYRLVTGELAVWVATVLPVLQAVLAGMLLLGVGRETALPGTAVLLMALCCVQASALVRGLRIGCGCFGAGNDTPVTWWSVTVVAGMACVAAIAAVVAKRGSAGENSWPVAAASRYALPTDLGDHATGLRHEISS